jgi:hypothetical protein
MKTRLILLGFLLILFITSCTVYQPLITDIPLISKKNELRVDVGVSIAPSANATISYGLTDKIAIQAYANTHEEDSYCIQGAIGYFKDLGKNKIMEIYGGYGYGYGDAYKDANPGNLMGNYQSYFAQFNFGKVNGRFAHLDYGFGVKTGLLHSNLTDKNFYENTYPENLTYLTYKDNSLLLEPTGFIRFGGEKLKVNFKLGGCWMYKFTNADKYFPYSHINFGIGLNYMF